MWSGCVEPQATGNIISCYDRLIKGRKFGCERKCYCLSNQCALQYEYIFSLLFSLAKSID